MSLGSLLWLGHHAGAVLFANFFWGVKLRDSASETFFQFFALGVFRAFRPFARRRLVAALTRNGAPQVLSGGLESGVLITMVEGEVLRVAFEEKGRRPG